MFHKKIIFIIISYLIFGQTQAQRFDHVQVTAVENNSGIGSLNHRLYRKDYIRLYVDSLALLLKHKKPDQEIILFIDGIPFEDLNPIFIMDSSSLIFQFEKNIDLNKSNKEESKAWAYFYKRPRKCILENKPISIGLKDHEAVKSQAVVDIVIIQDNLYRLGIALICVLVLSFIFLSAKSNLLRDAGEAAADSPPNQRPYSLARTQFSFWLLLISSAYVFLWISTGELPVLTSSTLILLGISGGTSIVAKLIDNNRILHINPKPVTSKGFFIDILSDENGIGIHRLQMVVFTIVIGVIFVQDVTVIFQMPDFDSNLLLLMGISSGTYAGFKATENNASIPVG